MAFSQNFQETCLMQIMLHKNARTTPAIRKEIQESSLSAEKLAKKFGIQKATALKWKHRDSVDDAPSIPHTFQKTMSDFEEFFVVELRKTLLLPLDNLLATDLIICLFIAFNKLLKPFFFSTLKILIEMARI